MKRPRSLPWTIVVVAVISWVAAIGIGRGRVTEPLVWSDALWGLSFLGLTVAGAVVVSRHPRNRFGWFILAGSCGVALGVLAADYANRIGEGMAWPGGAWVWHLGEVVFPMAIAILLVAFYRFPDGKLLPGRAWVAVDRLATGMVVLSGVTVLLDRTPGAAETMKTWPDPDIFWPSPLDRVLPLVEMDTVFRVVSTLTLVLGLGAFASLFVRYRQGTPTVRAQLRWVVWPVVAGLGFLSPVLIYDAVVAEPLPGIVEVFGTVVFTAGIPAGIFMAITRTGLYEIDRLIRRTVAYSIVTAVLVAVYGAAILAIGQVAGWLGATGNDVIVALSTLVAAALARPLFTTVRRTVDRRFHRAGRDAQLAVEVFRQGLRQDISGESVREGLIDAVARTLAPESVGVWVVTSGPLTRESS